MHRFLPSHDRMPRHGAMRRFRWLLAACLLLALPLGQATARADVPLRQLGFLSACSGAADIDRAVDALRADGWALIEQAGAAVIEDIAWINAAVYFAGDTGGETLDHVMRLQRKSAANLVQRADIPKSKHRFLARGGETMVIYWRGFDPRREVLECRAALDADTMSDIRASRPVTGALDAYIPLLPVYVDGARVEITLLNTATLAEQSPPDAIIHTYVTLRKAE